MCWWPPAMTPDDERPVEVTTRGAPQVPPSDTEWWEHPEPPVAPIHGSALSDREIVRMTSDTPM